MNMYIHTTVVLQLIMAIYAIGKVSVFFVIDLTPDVHKFPSTVYKGCLCPILNLKKSAWYSSSF